MQTTVTTTMPDGTVRTSSTPYIEPADISDFAEERLRQMVREGNLEAIKLAISLRPQRMEVTF